MPLLRVERHQRTGEILLRLHKHTTLGLSRDWMIALSITLGLHLFSLVLFRFPELRSRALPAQQTIWVEHVAVSEANASAQAVWNPRAFRRLLADSEQLLPTSEPRVPAWSPERGHKPWPARPLENPMPSFTSLEWRPVIYPSGPLPSEAP